MDDLDTLFKKFAKAHVQKAEKIVRDPKDQLSDQIIGPHAAGTLSAGRRHLRFSKLLQRMQRKRLLSAIRYTGRKLPLQSDTRRKPANIRRETYDWYKVRLWPFSLI